MSRQNIVCVAMTTWEGDYMKAVVHMMGNLAKNNRVLFIDYAFTFKDLVSGILGKSNIPVKRMLGISPRLRTISYQSHSLYHLTLPPILPINWISNSRIFDWIMDLQMWLVANFTIKKTLRNLKFDNPVMINAFNPILGVSLSKSLKVNRSIYYCYDEIAAADWCKKHGQRLEGKFAKNVDLVAVTSTALYESKSKINRNTILVKNGVDFNLFHQARHIEKQSSRHTIGYVGSIDFRLDYDLLEYLAVSMPESDFVFVGRITDPKGKSQMEVFPNVKFLGAQDPSLLPSLLAQFDVAIIPFVKNEFTRNIYPLKINEYLAAGVPVVATDFADLSDFSAYVSVVNSSEKFLGAILNSKLMKQTQIDQGVAFAKSNDWSNRAEQLETAISTLIK